MKLKNAALVASFFALAIFLLGCGGISGLKKMSRNINEVEVNSEPEVLEVHADSVDLTVSGKVPPKYFQPNGMIKISPVIYYEGGDTALEPTLLKGEKVELSAEDKEVYPEPVTINKKTGGSFSKSYKVPYAEGMKKAEIDADVSLKLESKYDELDKCVVPRKDSLSKGTITTSLTVKPTDYIMLGGIEPVEGADISGSAAREGTDEPEPGHYTGSFRPKEGMVYPTKGTIKPDRLTREMTILFDINRSFVTSSAKSSEAMESFRKFAGDTNVMVKGIKIKSYASPDGELSLNEDLTKDRAESTYKYIKDELKKLKVDEIYDSNFVKNPDTKEDWEGFKRLVEKSDISEKNEILKIANSSLPLDEKEDAIRKMDSWEPYIVEELLPQLRRSDITVMGVVKERSLSTIRAIAKAEGYSALTRNELARLGYYEKDIKKKEEIYEAIKEQYPDDWLGHNNIAATLLFEGRYEEAFETFTELNKRFPNVPHIVNNLGVAQRHLGMYDEARQSYEFVKSKSFDTRNNMAILDIKIAHYESSSSTFESNRCDYNTALAYHLNDDNETALEKIDCIVDKTADVHYLKAIVAAHMEDVDMMTTALRRSVEMDSSIKERAENDLEFRAYFENEEFKNALR